MTSTTLLVILIIIIIIGLILVVINFTDTVLLSSKLRIILGSLTFILGICGFVFMCIFAKTYETEQKSKITYVTSDGTSYNGNQIFEMVDGYYIKDTNGSLIKIDVVKIEKSNHE